MEFEILNTASHVKNRKREEEKCFHQKYVQSMIAFLLKERCICQRSLDHKQTFTFDCVLHLSSSIRCLSLFRSYSLVPRKNAEIESLVPLV